MTDKLPENIPLKYPVVLVHGIACRDKTKKDEELSWGPIPEMLRSRGVQVYFGHSDAWASIENNAQQIKDTVNDIIDSTGCSKVNIIAHSKGGLDVRYMISKLGMADKVASLTTMDTPHRGVFLVDVIYKYTPRKLASFVTVQITKRARRKGDTHPNCYICGKELSVSYCKKFNATIQDDPHVLYQSVVAFTKAHSPKYWFTALFTKLKLHQENDGIVTCESGRWGRVMSPTERYSHDHLRGCGLKTKQKLILLLYANILLNLALMGL